MLLNILLVLIGVICTFGLIVCAIEKHWGTVFFGTIMLGSTLALLLYGAGHIA